MESIFLDHYTFHVLFALFSIAENVPTKLGDPSAVK
jgi:hypothetical protein